MLQTINLEMVDELKDLMEDDFSILIETFLADCETRLEQLEAAISEGNAKEIRELAHGFKGSSSNLGAEKLSEISFVVETMGRKNELTGISETTADLIAEYQLVKEYFNTLI